MTHGIPGGDEESPLTGGSPPSAQAMSSRHSLEGVGRLVSGMRDPFWLLLSGKQFLLDLWSSVVMGPQLRPACQLECGCEGGSQSSH